MGYVPLVIQFKAMTEAAQLHFHKCIIEDKESFIDRSVCDFSPSANK
jgi:hypothetical protein